MEAKKMLAYFVLLLGSVAVCSARRCNFVPNADLVTDEWLEQDCFVYPELAAAADGYTGTDDDKRKEMFAQCVLFMLGFFTGDDLDVERFKEKFRGEDEWKNGVASCDSSLLESYQAYEYLRCLEEYCEEA